MCEAGGRGTSEQDELVPPKSLLVTLFPVCRQTAPYSPELEPDIVLTQLHVSGVDEILHTLW